MNHCRIPVNHHSKASCAHIALALSDEASTSLCNSPRHSSTNIRTWFTPSFEHIHALAQKALYVTDDECVGIEGMEDNPARELIAELAALIIEERFHYRHEWQVGDLLMWDNASVQHIAIRDYAWPQRRLMYRTTVNGSKPF